MDDFERHVIIHLVMRSVGLVWFGLHDVASSLSRNVVVVVVLVVVCFRHEFCHLEGVMHSTVASKSNRNEQHPSVC